MYIREIPIVFCVDKAWNVEPIYFLSVPFLEDFRGN